MALHLTIIKAPAGMTIKEDRRTFNSDSIIGRSAKSDWVLNDPERFLSSKHCQIKNESGTFFLIDLSTNGTFVNGAQEPLGRGTQVALNDGDSFDVGDYRFKVSLEDDNDALADSPFASSAPGSSADPQNMVFNEDANPDPESMYMSSAYSGSVADITPDEMKVVDPLVALNIASGDAKPSRPSSASDPIIDSKAFSGSQEDSADFLSSSAEWPESKPEESVIPEDWADDISLLGAHKPSASESGSGGAGYRLPDNDSLIVSKPDSSITPRAEAVIAKPTPARPSPPPSPPKPVARASTDSNIDRTLIDALGLSDADLSDDQVRDIHQTIGIMTRETLEGLMQILRSRNSIKNEFRINITTIQPIENNPLKFSANVDDVLENMFLKDSRAYKKPIDSVQESINTIVDHQMAMIAGIRSAFKSVLLQFDPQTLEEEFKESGKAGVLGGVMKGKLWSAYQAHYQSIVNNMERSFQELFGDDFVQAYEDQLRKLSAARKRNHD